MTITPKERVHQEVMRLKNMHETLKSRALFDKERMLRERQSARLRADQMENYLASLNSAYRSTIDFPQRIQGHLKQAYPSSELPVTDDALRYFPTSYPNLRRAVRG